MARIEIILGIPYLKRLAAGPATLGRRYEGMRTSIAAAAIALIALAATPAVAQTYTWSNGANTGLWGTSGNWVGSPSLTFGNTTDIVFNSASVANTGNAVAIGANRTIRSITINANYVGSSNATFDIQTQTAISSGSANLTFQAASGSASITVAQSTSGAQMVRLGVNNTGTTVLNSNLDLVQNNTFLDTGGNGFMIESRLQGGGSINKTGAGLVRLLRNNSLWTGNMNINDGAVMVGNDPGNVFGTGTWTLGGGANNTRLVIRKFFNDGVAANPGGIVVAAGDGTRTIANTSFDGGGVLRLSGSITLSKDAIFEVASHVVTTGDRMTLSGTLTGVGGIVKTSNGILILSASNNYSGTTDIQGGKLYLEGAGRLGSGAVTIASGANLDFATGASQTNVVANNISGAGQIFQNVASTDTRFTGNVTSTGGLTINTGIVRIGNGGTTGSYAGDATVASGATLAFARSDAYAHGGTISGAGSVSKTAAGDVTLTGSNAYSGNTSLFAGALVADHANALGSGGNIIFSSGGGSTGTIRYTAASAGTDWASRIVNSAAPIRLDTNGNNVNLAGAIASTNTNGLVKSGSGVLTLGGANAYTGATNVDAGGLIINGSLASTGLATVASAARIGGDGSLAGALTLLSGARFIFNPSATLDVAGAVTLDNTFSLASLVAANGGAIDWTSIATGTYTLIGTTSQFDNIQNFGVANAANIDGGRTAYFQNGSLQLVIVPEPGALALAAAGVGLAAAWSRRRRK